MRKSLPWMITLLALAALVGPPLYSQTQVANAPSDLANKILMVADSATGRTVTNLFTFDRGAAVPFAVGATSLKVTNLDADKIDGIDSTGFATLAGVEVFTNKTLTAPTINAATLSGTLAGTPTASGAWTFSSGDSTTKAGNSTETFKGSGVIDVDSTQQGTGANTTDTALRTYSLPANALNSNGRIVRVTAWGSFAANGNTKTVRLKWNGLAGTTVTSHTSTSNGTKWVIMGWIVRTGSSTQDIVGFLPMSAASQDISSAFTTSTATDTGAIDIIVGGLNGSASASDIVYEGSIIEFLN